MTKTKWLDQFRDQDLVTLMTPDVIRCLHWNPIDTIDDIDDIDDIEDIDDIYDIDDIDDAWCDRMSPLESHSLANVYSDLYRAQPH